MEKAHYLFYGEMMNLGAGEPLVALSYKKEIEEGSSLFSTTPDAAAMEESGLAVEAFARSTEGATDDDGEETESDMEDS